MSMLPRGMNPRQMEKMMKRMGIKVDEIDAVQVIIKCVDKEIIIDNPSVARTNVAGQDMFQVSGDVREEAGEAVVEISDDDVSMVADQAGVTPEEARAALEEAGGDLAGAIMKLKS